MGKTLTKADVFDVASDLIEQNGSTTTLDIKTELRNRGFFAKQADVSELMIEVCQEEGYTFTFNGVHRVYSEGSTNSQNSQTKSVSLSAALQAAGKTVATQTQTATGQSHTTRSGKVITAYASKADAKSNDWVVYSTINQVNLYFPGSYSRDEVRIAYRAIVGVHMTLTRACRQ